MNAKQLERRLSALGVSPDAYSLHGGLPDECYVLNREVDGWSVYYSERGLRTGEQRYSTESDACAALLQMLTEV